MLRQFINLPVGKRIKIGDIRVSCIPSKNIAQFGCILCHFKEQGAHCPQGKKRPACFASERLDKESVFYSELKPML